MTTPVQAVFWQIWHGWRWGLVIGGAYLLAAAVTAHLLPDFLRRTPQGEAFLPNTGTELALPCICLVIHLAAAFSLTGADLKERGYWKTMFVLPVRTRTLVAWPMIWGSLALGCVWLVVALFVMRPTGNAVPLVWPIAALAAGLTLCQALSWMPLAQHWLSIVFAIPSALLLGMIVAVVAVFEVPEPIATATFLAILPLTYVACLRGVAAARRGDAFDWRQWNRLLAWAAAWRKAAEHPFHSAGRAQLWFECRAFAWLLPLCMAMLVPFIAIAVLLEPGSDLASSRPLAMLLLLPVGLAAMVGYQLGNASFPFVATRPVSTAALVRSKFVMALVSALAAYIPVLLVVPLFFVRPGFFDSTLQAARAAGMPKTALVLLLAVVLPVLLTWKGLAESLWMGLTGRAWLEKAFAFGFATLFGCGILFGLWVTFYPQVQALLWSLAPWLLGLLLVVKMILAIWVLSSLVRWRLVRITTAGLAIGVWSLVVVVLCLICVWLIPPQLISTSIMLAGVVLGIPFSRIAGAPLALAWNRHR
ncbi:MAG: hypothetical protein L0211_10075 [Planctomycetaceae bacterium]|nr:hypothetical protein [Planctomycetaceae bacterium]